MMATPAFGFSFGDIITAIALIKKVSVALKDSGGAAEDYQCLLRELQQLQLLFEQLNDLPTSSSSSLNHYNAVRGMANEVLVPLRAFVEKMKRNYERLGPSGHESNWRSVKSKVQWAISMREEVREMRAIVTMKIVSLSVLLTIPTSETLLRIERRLIEAENNAGALSDQYGVPTEKLIKGQDAIEDDVKDESQGIQFDIRRLLDICIGFATGVDQLDKRQISLEQHLQIFAMRTHTIVGRLLQLLSNFSKEALQYLKCLHFSNVEIYTLLVQIQNSIPRLPTGLLQDNITFVDVLNRKHSLQYAFFQHYEVFESMLLCEFKGKPGEMKVRNCRYLILNTKIPGEIITRDDWSKLVLPGSEINMSILLSGVYDSGTNCPRTGCFGMACSTSVQQDELVECNRCGLQFMPYVPVVPCPASSESLYPTAWESTGPQGLSMKAPTLRRKGQSLQLHAWHFNSMREYFATVGKFRKPPKQSIEERRRRAQHDVAVLCVFIEAVMSFRRLAARLRKREEEELRVFKVVHIRASFLRGMEQVSCQDSESQEDTLQSSGAPLGHSMDEAEAIREHQTLLQDRDEWTELHKAAESGHVAAVRLLLDGGADVAAKDSFKWTALHPAAKSGHETVARLLLEEGADVAAKDCMGRTALHWAAENGHEAVVRLLLENGADVAAKDVVGRTAIYWAAENGHEVLVRLLHENGAALDVKDNTDRTVLHRAAEKGQEAVVQLLLENGVDVAATDKNKRTALHWAVENGHKAVVLLLLKKGADVAAEDNIGRTVLFWAMENGQEAMVRLLTPLTPDP